MKDENKWFEALAIDEAKEERIILRMWLGRLAALAGLLCVVVYATSL
jgi:hypothetical protein